ncbi:MAG: hypothetical protein AB1716_17870 [Planctomycetota bacterium]
MAGVPGRFRKGRIELDAPVDWREGLRVTVSPEEEPVGLDESQWPSTPAALEKFLAEFDAFEPVEFSPEEQAEIDAARAAVRDVTIKAVRRRMEQAE